MGVFVLFLFFMVPVAVVALAVVTWRNTRRLALFEKQVESLALVRSLAFADSGKPQSVDLSALLGSIAKPSAKESE